MTISFALKEKNRIAGRIVKLQGQVKKYNKFEAVRQRDFDSSVLLIELQEQWAYLIDLKSKLARANVGIAEKLIRLAEAKAELVFWTEFVNFAGQKESLETRSVRKNGGYEDVDFVTHSSITSKEAIENQARCQKLIESLQDEIDSYNALTTI